MVEESGTYELDIAFTASGYVTDTRILDDGQNLVSQNIDERISAKEELSLSAGEHTFYVEHLYDWEALESYCDTVQYTFNADAAMLRHLKSSYAQIKQDPSLPLAIKRVET